MPASAGEQGPGETTSRSSWPACSRAFDLVERDLVVAEHLDLAPSSPKYWTML
jgi:hypothetical protein